MTANWAWKRTAYGEDTAWENPIEFLKEAKVVQDIEKKKVKKVISAIAFSFFVLDKEIPGLYGAEVKVQYVGLSVFFLCFACQYLLQMYLQCLCGIRMTVGSFFSKLLQYVR